jgi:Zn finger protein HypA/HybF involved in hydrogenase expression
MLNSVIRIILVVGTLLGLAVSALEFAFIIVFLCLLLHYTYIDVEGLQRINEKNVTLQPLTNVFPASLFFSFSVFLYGIFLNLFASMYVYRKKE